MYANLLLCYVLDMLDISVSIRLRPFGLCIACH